MASARLTAAGGLAVTLSGHEIRGEFGSPDWFGPGRFTIAGEPQDLAITSQTDGRDALGTYSLVVVSETGELSKAVPVR